MYVRMEEPPEGDSSEEDEVRQQSSQTQSFPSASQQQQQQQEEVTAPEEAERDSSNKSGERSKKVNGGNMQQIRTLMWKHCLEEIRQPVKLLAQCCIPVVVICVLVLAHAVTNQQRSYSHCFFQPKALPTSGVLSFFQTKLCDWNSTCLDRDHPVRGSDLRGFRSPERLIQLIEYANDNAQFNNLLLDFLSKVQSRAPYSLNDLLEIASHYSGLFSEPEFQGRLFNVTSAISSDYRDLTNNNIFAVEADSGGISKVHIALYNLSAGVCGVESTEGNFAQFMSYAGIDRDEFLRDRRDVVTLDFSATRSGSAAASRRRRKRRSVASADGDEIFAAFRRYYDCHRYKDFTLWNTPLYSFWRMYTNHYYGNVLYAPNTPTVNKIIEKARTVFHSVQEAQDFISNWNSTYRGRLNHFLSMFLSHEESARHLCNLLIKQNNGLCDTISLDHWRQAVKIVDLLLPEVDTFLSCFFNKLKDPFVGFSNMSELWRNLPNFTSNSQLKSVLEFHVSPDEQELRDKPGFIKYTLHPKAWFTDHPDDLRELKEPNNPGPRRHWTDVKFLVYSYVDTQDIVEWAIAEVLSGSRVRDGIYMQMQPYMCWLHDEFLNTFRNFLHFFLIISWVVLVGVIVQKIVYEKESRLKEMILVMGVSREIMWLTWFLSSLGIFLVPTLICSIVLKVTICKLVSFSVVFFTLFTYSMLSILSAFFLSTLFSKANVGATLSSFLYLMTYIPYAVCKLVLNLEFHPAGHFILSLLPNVAFAYTFDGILKFEHFSVPVYWSTLQQSPYVLRNFTVAGALAMMWLDAALLLLATAYVEQVHSGTRGASKSWYFLCSTRFWKYILRRYFTARPGSGASTTNCRSRDYQGDSRTGRSADAQQVPISIQRLCKAYGRHRVLKDFNLSLYRNHLTSLVGKNGCGKSTLMSILCGLDSASSGHVTMFGHSHPEELGVIRQWIGVCPQFDTVFGFLTVKEHVDFYGSLKGLSKAERCGEVDEIVHLLSLPEDTRVYQLSGGQRRKLSLLLAFLGQVKFVILDEPTAGVDPISRHAIWELIQRLKAGKTILMTSHHLDEAEALADRIAVLGTGGKIHFHDTPGKLKRLFSDSQMLTVSFVQGADCQSHASQLFELISACAAQGARSSPSSTPAASPSSEVEAAPTAQLDWQKRGNDLYFRIPNSVARLCMTELLKCIETEKSRYQILRFQISQPTMEDIFFLITGGEGGEEAEAEASAAAAGSSRRTAARRQRHRSESGAGGSFGDLSFIRTDFSSDGLTLPNLPTAADQGGFELSDAAAGFNDSGVGDGVVVGGESSVRSSRVSLVPTETGDDRRPRISRAAQLACQVEAILLKRLRYMIRTPSCLLTNIFLPILFLAVAIAMIQLRPGWRSSPPVEIHPWHLKVGYPNQANSLHYFYDYPDPFDSEGVQPPAAALYAEQLNMGFQGCRCMNSSVYSIPGYPCYQSVSELNDTDHLDQSCNACSFYCQPVDFPHQTRRLAVRDIAHKLPRNGSDKLFNISNWLIQTSNDYLLNRFGGASFSEVNPLTDAVARGSEAFETAINRLHNATLRHALASMLNFSEAIRFIDAFYGRRWSSKVWFDNMGYVAGPAYLNVFNNARLRALLADQQQLPTSGIAAFLDSLPPDGQGLRLDFDHYGYMMALVGIFIALSLSAFPCSAVCLLVEERSSGALHLQKLFTIPLWLYWLVNFMFDLAIYTCIAGVVTVTLHLLGGEAFHHSQDALSAGILCWSYGLAALPLNYLLSLFFSEQSRAYISLFAVNLLLSILTCLLYSIIYVLQQYNLPLRDLMPKLKRILLIACPQFGIAEGIYTVQTNYFLGKVLEEWYGKTGVYKNLLSYQDGLLKNASCFVGHCLLFWLAIVLIENLVYGVGKVSKKSLSAQTETQSSRPNIEVRNVCKRYGGKSSCRSRGGGASSRPAVDDVSFSVASGEVLGLLGSNGAGKSSIFRMLTRGESITSGSIRVGGRLNNSFDCFSDAGYCSQSNVLWKTMSPVDHLAFYARCKGFRGQALQKEVDSLVHRLGLSENSAKPSGHLSGGNRRRLCVAIAFIGSPDVVLLDEPTAGVDVVARRRIWKCIQRARRMQQSILLTSHSMEECELLCNRILIMKSGRLLAQGSVDDLVKQFCQGFVLRLLLRADAAAELSETIVGSLAEELGLDGSCEFKTDERDETKEVHILLKPSAGLVGEAAAAAAAGISAPFVQVYEALRQLQCRHVDEGFISFALVHPSVEEVFHRVMSLSDKESSETSAAAESLRRPTVSVAGAVSNNVSV
ncbi:hypothetical protein BOX15_Mlig028900g1 [Macrostomum lignano]|uniref:ABC transporter domain-containing protein n=1 Tax=Macrostomum lignano TaxID=282301 RepID=A0A267ECR7_9PLAT|nr:hypothetical protein BOX15_Mlig028900g1 [Macrostomum lignano]